MKKIVLTVFVFLGLGLCTPHVTMGAPADPILSHQILKSRLQSALENSTEEEDGFVYFDPRDQILRRVQTSVEELERQVPSVDEPMDDGMDPEPQDQPTDSLGNDENLPSNPGLGNPDTNGDDAMDIPMEAMASGCSLQGFRATTGWNYLGMVFLGAMVLLWTRFNKNKDR